ncbi:NEDD8-conjugating enzyme Ubc12 [Micractinium conductrix]|uniref:NEDD8-conjugating enzyme Ubc12 n=1 Tax=Micractinium conductrix TaxID=554055 RepID=A0A2P6VQJ6_9CHLO|nr:NEDD8-conjugating enzyme Ubc12 [Micractinium conductrix]|eukprot:PSC76337.1 NEDD8-conjugating enzyme Ubc12 [Micractinium conductrix]
MIKLFSVKEKQKKDAAAAANGKAVKQSAGELRLQKDISELDLPKSVAIRFPDGQDKIMSFEITMKPDEGLYKGGAFLFSFNVPSGYPHDPPKVKCLTKVYHPNIDLEGNICLNILREDWKPVLTITAVVYGLNFLFLAPNPDDPLNKEAAQMMAQSPGQFERLVSQSITRGCSIAGEYFPPARGDRSG